MHKKITISLFVTCIFLLSCKAKSYIITDKDLPVKDSILVYENNKVVGKISQQTTHICKECYTLSNSEIENIKIKIPVSNRNINNKSVLEQDFAVDKMLKDDENTVLKYSSTSSSKSYEIAINKNKSGDTYIVRSLTNSYGSKDIKIGDNDYESFQSNFICQSEKKIKIKETITLNDSPVFLKEDCFDCPVKYTIEECLANKKKGVKMKWE